MDDLDGDGSLDVVCAVVGSGALDEVAILMGRGDGTFDPFTSFPVGDTPDTVAIGDVDGDRVLDIVASTRGSEDISVLLGNGDGSFRPVLTFLVGANRGSLVLQDVDGDQIPDFTFLGNQDDVEVVRNRLLR